MSDDSDEGNIYTEYDFPTQGRPTNELINDDLFG